MFQMDPTKLVDDRPIGKTSTSTVYPYRLDAFDHRWVVKRIVCNDLDYLTRIMQQIAIGYNCEHPGIVPIRAFNIEPATSKSFTVLIKMPRMEENLQQVIETKKPVEQGVIIKHLYSLVSALDYLHTRRIPHRNIKPTNVLISREGEAKFGDAGSPAYGIAGKGDSEYLAPEMGFPMKSTKKKELYQSDIWSLAAVIAELCLIGSKKGIGSLLSEDKGPAVKQVIDQIKDKYDLGLVTVIADMLSLNPRQRKSAKDIKTILEERFKSVLKGEGGHQVHVNTVDSEVIAEGWKKEEIKLNTGKTFQMPKKTVEIPELPILKNEKKISAVKVSSGTGRNWDIFVKDMQESWGHCFQMESKKPMYISALRKAGVDDKSLKGFIKDVSDKIMTHKVEDIRGIDLNLLGCEKISDSGLGHFGMIFGQGLRSLDNLSLQFSPWDYSNKITDSGLKQLSLEIGRNLTELKQLSLSFSLYDSITDAGMASLSLNICEKLDQLQKLKLEFTECRNITDKGLERLTTNIVHMKRDLKHLTLNLYDCPKITEEGINYYATNITQSLRGLELFGLDLSRSNITDEEIKILATSAGHHLIDLREFYLKFDGCSRISDRGVMHIAVELGKNFEHLQDLNLNFYDCRKITDEALSFLSSNIGQNLRNLRRLSLDFSRSQASDHGIRSITSNLIPNVRNLDQLSLNFYWCGGITDEGAQSLAKAIHFNLKYLEKLKLNFCDCWEVTEDRKNTLSRLFSGIPDLLIE